MRENVTCQQVREGLREYLDDAAPPGTADAIGHHLAGCPACGGFVAEIQGTRALLSALPRPAMPAPMKAALLQALRQHPAA